MLTHRVPRSQCVSVFTMLQGSWFVDGVHDSPAWYAQKVSKSSQSIVHVQTTARNFLRFPQEPAACSHDLLTALVARLQDVRQPPVLRATCAAYAASFLARASFIPNALVVQALQVRKLPLSFAENSNSDVIILSTI